MISIRNQPRGARLAAQLELAGHSGQSERAEGVAVGLERMRRAPEAFGVVFSARAAKFGQHAGRFFDERVHQLGRELGGRSYPELGVPVKLVGLGEGPDDLAPFEPEAFVDAIHAGGAPAPSARGGWWSPAWVRSAPSAPMPRHWPVTPGAGSPCARSRTARCAATTRRCNAATRSSIQAGLRSRVT